MPSRALLPIVLFSSILTAAAASAASPDAWAAFRKDVEASCRAAGAALIQDPAVTVDPFGSESYGLAFLTGKAVEDGNDRSLVCIYDKVTHKSEIGGAMALQKAGAPAVVDGGPPAPAAVTASDAETPAKPPQAAQPAPAPAADTATAGGVAPVPPAAAAPASASPTNPDAEAALADRFASFPDDPQEPEAAAPPTEAQRADAPSDPDQPVSPQNQPVVTPPVPILPSVPSPTGEVPATDEAAVGEGDTASDVPAAGEAESAMAAAAPPAAGAAGVTPTSFANCDAACTATLAPLAGTDRKSLADLPFEIERTIARNAQADLAAGPAAARAAAGAIAANLTGRPSPSIAAPTAALVGERSCVLYYFGYNNQAARTVGRHRCSVTEEGGTLVVEKISGEHLRAELRPLTAGVAAFVGRTFKTGGSETRYDPQNPVSAADKDLGNSVGLATASEGRMMLTSAELRRFAGEDNFFWVLAIDPK